MIYILSEFVELLLLAWKAGGSAQAAELSAMSQKNFAVPIGNTRVSAKSQKSEANR